MHRHALAPGWPTTSGGIGVPEGVLPGSTGTVWISHMELAALGSRSDALDVWVHPAYLPGG